MSKVRFTDGQRAVIQPLLPPRARTGRPRAPDRGTLEGSRYVLRSGCRWQDLPRQDGAPPIVWRRVRTWQEGGTWLRPWRTVSAASMRGAASTGPTPSSMARSPRRSAAGLTREGKGTTWLPVVDGQGLPLGLHLNSAQKAEVTLAAQALDAVRVPRQRGRPKQRPARLVADRAYDSAAFRQLLAAPRRGDRSAVGRSSPGARSTRGAGRSSAPSPGAGIIGASPFAGSGCSRSTGAS